MWKRVLRRELLGVVALPVLWAILIFGPRSLGPNIAQKRALALIDAPQRTIERNQFAALWLAAYDIPASDIDAILAQDSAAYAALPPEQRDIFHSAAEGRYPKLSPITPGIDCDPMNCSDAVRRDPEATRTLLHMHARHLEHVEALANHDAVRWPFTHAFGHPMHRSHARGTHGFPARVAAC